MRCIHLIQFRDAAHSHVDLGDLIPGRIIDHSGNGQTEYRLEFADCITCGAAIDAIGSDRGDRRIVAVNTVELLLDLAHL